MKKIIILAAAVVCAALLLCGCGRNRLLDEIQTVTTGDTSSLHYASKAEEAPEISFAEQFGDDADYPVWLWCDRDMNNAALISLSYSENAEKPTAGDTIYSFGDLLSSKGIILYIQPEETQPSVGFTYCSGGQQYVYALTMGKSGVTPTLIEIIKL